MTNVLDNDSRAIVQQFLTTPIVVVAVDGTCAVVPNETGSCAGNDERHRLLPGSVRPDPRRHATRRLSGSPLDVRTVIINPDGSLLQQLVQQRGVIEYGIQAVGAQKTNTTRPAALARLERLRDTTNTGVQDILILHPGDSGFSTAVAIWLDATGHQTTTNTGIPVIVDVPQNSAGATEVYVDASFNKVFNAMGGNLLANGNFSTSVPIERHGRRLDEQHDRRRRRLAFGGYFILNSNGAANTDPDDLPDADEPAAGRHLSGDRPVHQRLRAVRRATNAGSFWPRSPSPFGVGTRQLASFSAQKSNATGWTTFTFTFTADGTTATLTLAARRTARTRRTRSPTS